MAEKIKLKISPAVAAFVLPGISAAEKLRGLEAAADMTPADQVLLTFCLMRDADAVIKGAATVAFGSLPEYTMVAYIRKQGAHPAILDAIARYHHTRPDVVAALLVNETLTPQASGFLQRFAALNEQSLVDNSDENSPPEVNEDSDEGGLLDELDAEDVEQMADGDDSDEDE